MNDELKSIILAASELNVDLKNPKSKMQKSVLDVDGQVRKLLVNRYLVSVFFRKEIFQRDVGVPMRARNRAERRAFTKKK